MNRQYCLTLELQDDAELIATYEHYHQPGNVWPEVLEAIRDSGIQDMNIYRTGTLLVMVLEVDDRFSFEAKAELDSNNPGVQQWERLMERFQKADSNDRSQSKWKQMKPIFRLQGS